MVSLIGKVYEPANLRMAFYQVKENKGGAGVIRLKDEFIG